MSRNKRRKKYAEMHDVWLLVSIRYAFNQFKFNSNNNEQRTSSSTREQVARPEHSNR